MAIAFGPPPASRSHPKPARDSGVSPADGAQGLAIRALGFIAADTERLERFLTLSGLAPDSIREAAAAPGFLAGVLEHLCGDEPSLLAFAEEAGIDPAAIAGAAATLARVRPDASGTAPSP